MAFALKFIQSTVVSTRIRLARNFAAYPFPKRMDDSQAEDIVVLVREGLRKLDDFTEYNLTTLAADEVKMLQEQYLISAALTKDKGSAAFLSSDKTTSIMVNEEDHLRQQYICKGFELFKAYERISALDEWLSARYDFAFDDELGFLTACPSNLGTGMRASVMMFLPGLETTGKLQAHIAEVKARGMTVRGAFGEGTSAEGFLYQVSNERTLGWSEQDILSEVMQTAISLCDKEQRARERLLKTDGDELRDKCLRAYGTLTHCGILSDEEFLAKMTDVRLGMALGFIEPLDRNGFEEFLNVMRPSAFLISNGLKGKRQRYCDKVRAETVGKVLPELVVVRK